MPRGQTCQLCNTRIPQGKEAYCRDCDVGPVCPDCAREHREKTCARKQMEEKGHDLYPASGTACEGD